MIPCHFLYGSRGASQEAKSGKIAMLHHSILTLVSQSQDGCLGDNLTRPNASHLTYLTSYLVLTNDLVRPSIWERVGVRVVSLRRQAAAGAPKKPVTCRSRPSVASSAKS